ncbi:hypothetical protein B0H19DRAFT_1079428 [Mycena capillaripes]|nr:hypothetical protein B0H19DRAFT_1079428 [Mycena capillaripes]
MGYTPLWPFMLLNVVHDVAEYVALMGTPARAQVLKQVSFLEASWLLRLEQYGLEERAEGTENQSRQGQISILSRNLDADGTRHEGERKWAVDVWWTSSWWERRKINMGAHHLTLIR